MWKRILATAWAVTALASVLAAGQLHVPGHYTELQDAIDNAQPGDTIIVHGGVFDPITIDKPLTIIGEPRPWIRFDETSNQAIGPDVTLAGDGTGVLVLRKLYLGGGYLGFNFPNTSPVISGGGFEELHVHDCVVEAAQYGPVIEGDCCFQGKAAIAASVPQILVSHSQLRASSSDSGVCDYLPPQPQAAIEASGSTVVLIDSYAEGGGQEWLCSDTGCLDPAFVRSSLLAPGVRAQELFDVNSTIVGGRVRLFFEDLDPNYGYDLQPCREVPRADPLAVGQHVPLPYEMRAFTDLTLGRTWTVYWNSSGQGFSTLFLSTKALMPPIEMTTGWFFIDFEGLLAPRVVYGTAIRRFDYVVPLNLNLIGVEIIAQVLDPVTGLTNPIADCVGPLVPSQQVTPYQSP